MTPKDKAKELVNKFNLLLPCEGTTTLQTAIDCALIAVDEIINHCSLVEPFLCFDYWQQVKQEIENL